MPKPITIMYRVIPAKDEEERAALRPIGRASATRPRSGASPRSSERSTRWVCVCGSAAIEHLKYVLPSPRYHHWHHSSDEEAIDKNYVAHR